VLSHLARGFYYCTVFDREIIFGVPVSLSERPLSLRASFFSSFTTTHGMAAHKLSAEMQALVDQKRDIEQKLSALEKQIYALEGSYLDDTHHLGNIIRGWDGYLSSRSGALKKMRFRDSDRLFTMSSLSASKYLTNTESDGPSSYASNNNSSNSSNNNNGYAGVPSPATSEDGGTTRKRGMDDKERGERKSRKSGSGSRTRRGEDEESVLVDV